MMAHTVISHFLARSLPTFTRWLGSLVLGLIGLAWVATTAQAADVAKTPQTEVRLLVWAPKGYTAGSTVWAGLQVKHAKDWHTYWKNPGDAGLPMELNWTLPKGWKAGDIAWPTPKKFPLTTLAGYGYDGTVLLPIPLKASGNATTPLTLSVQAQWLVCRTECIPEGADLSLTLPPAQVAAQEFAALFEDALSRRPEDLKSAVSRASVDGKRLQVSVEGLPAHWLGQRLEWFPEVGELIFPGEPWEQQWKGPIWQASLPLNDQRPTSPGLWFSVLTPANVPHGTQAPAGVRVKTHLQGGWNASAAVGDATPAPKTSITVPSGTDLVPAGSPTEPATSPASTSLGSGAGLGGSSMVTSTWAWALVAAFAGGLILNLMPCVFPILAIKVLSLAQSADNRQHRLMSAWAYGLAVVASFAALGGLLLALRSAGEAIGWGFQLQSPSMLVGLSLLFALITLNLAGAFEFGNLLPSGMAGVRLRHPVMDSAWSGVLAVAVASPCTAPFMGASLGLAVTLPTAQAVAIFVALGAGMAAPMVLAGIIPGVLSWLPKPGAWMQTLRQVMAFPMAITVVWLVWVLTQIQGADAMAAMLLVMLALVFALWAWNRHQGRAVWRSLGVLALLTSLVWGMPIMTRESVNTPAMSTSNTGSTQVWQAWSPEREAAELAAGRSVFVDYTAAWCLTCQVNESQVLNQADVMQSFREGGWVLLKADWTRPDPRITASLAKLGRNGIPTYAVLKPGREPVVLAEILTRAQVLDALAR